MTGPPYYDADTVSALLDHPGCIDAMERAMAGLSAAGREQPLRQIVALQDGKMFGVMPGDLSALATFGAKLISVFPEGSGRSRHRGVVAAFDLATGELTCLADAESITAIRTACATAAATRALARGDARVLAVFGTGLQARMHLAALGGTGGYDEILVWGRDPANARALAAEMSAELGRPVTAESDAASAARRADVICTVTGSASPVLLDAWVRDGTHVNLVGSSRLGPVEVDTPLVARARYFADYRPGVLAQGSELAVARAAGAVSEDHIAGEIGEVFNKTRPGRDDAAQVTIYKSLGHVAQDLAAALYVHRKAQATG